MFESERYGIGGEDEPMQVVLGLVDDYGRVIGWFGREYHPNTELVDSVGALEPPLATRPRLVIGVSDEDETYIIGGLGSFLKKVAKAVAAPITAPVTAAVAIAKGKNVLKSVTKSVAAPVTSSLSLARVMTKPVVKTAAAALKPIAGKSFASSFKTVAMAPLSTKAINLATAGKFAQAAKAAVKPATAAIALTKSSIAPVIKTASAVAKPFVGTKVSKALTSASLSPLTAAQQLTAGKIQQAGMTMYRDAGQTVRAAAPILKSPVTKAVVTGVALAFPPVGVPLAAGVAAANLALPYATAALGAADKVLAAAKGTLPAQLAAPPDVAQALQSAAKFTVGKTYQAAALGSQDAQRAVQVLVAARRVQQAIPAAQAAIHPAATLAEGAIAQAPIVAQGSGVLRGTWQKVSSGATHNGPMVLPNGVVVRGGWRSVA